MRHAVILAIIASNLLGCLSPIGNPQNIGFLFLIWTAAGGWLILQF